MRPLKILVICLLSGFLVTPPNLALPADDEVWLRVETGAFTVMGNASEARLVDIAANLEQFREALSQIARGLQQTSPIPTYIFVFRDSESMAPYNLGQDGEREELAGYFLRSLDVNYVVIDASAGTRPYAVIYHEYVHYLLENSVPSIPLWLNEGLAEFYSTFRIEESTAIIGAPVASHIEWLSAHPAMSLDLLFGVDTSSPEYNERERIGTFYAQSWALTHYLLVDSERRAQMGKLLGLLSEATPSVEAFQTAFGTELLTAEKQLTGHVGSGAKRFLRFELEQNPQEHEAGVVPLARETLLFHLGDLLVRRTPFDDVAAEEHLTAALALDRDSANVHTGLATLRARQGRLDEAVELATKALSLSPGDSRALTVRGAIHMDRFASAPQEPQQLEKARAILRRAREDFRAAVEKSPDHVDALVGLGDTYLLEESGLEEGVTALARANRLRPERNDVLAKLIVLTANTGNVEGAQALLDRRLIQRGDADSIAVAENALVYAQMREVRALLEANDPESALDRAKEVAERVRTPDLRSNLVTWIGDLSSEYRAEILRRQAYAAGAAGDKKRAEELMRQIGNVYGSGTQAEEETDTFNRAVGLANDGKREDALELLERIAATTARPDVRSRSEHLINQLRDQIVRQRHIDLYNEAVDALGQEEVERAESLLSSLLEQKPDDEMKQDAERLLRVAQRYTDQGSDVDKFNQALALAKQDQYEAAAELFEQVAANTSRTDLKSQASEQAQELRAIAATERAVSAYNEAVDAARDSDYSRSESILVRLLDDPVSAEVHASATELLEVVQGLKGYGKKPRDRSKKRKKKKNDD